MEIERKFLVLRLPEHLEEYPHTAIEQAYLCEDPVLRIRKRDNSYLFTYKSKGLMIRQEQEFPLTREAYLHLLSKADGRIISKTRYLIPFGSFTIELDVFCDAFAPLVLAEVEFETEEQANAFCPPDWFGQDVTADSRYQNVNMALHPKADAGA